MGKIVAIESKSIPHLLERGHDPIHSILMWGTLLRLLVAAWNALVGPTPGADLDALGAHLAAENIANTSDFLSFKMGTTQYINFLSALYFLLWPSQFLGATASILAWYVGARALLASMQLMAMEQKRREMALMVYSFMPSAILLTGVTLREPFQMALLNLSLLYFLRACLRWDKRNWLYFLACVSVVGTLHGALLAFGIVYAILAIICFALLGRRVTFDIRIISALLVVGGILLAGVNFFTAFSYDLSDGLLSAVETYQDRLLSIDARTHYKGEAEIGSGVSMIAYFAWSLVQYWLEPFPWRPLTGPDIVLLGENLLRLWLMGRALRNIHFAKGSERKILICLAASYVILEFIWSIGTINWGTALRHHLPSFGMLVVLGFAGRAKVNA